MIDDAFENHLPDPSVLVEPAQVYAERLTEATVEKLAPLTNLVRDSVEGIAEARLSIQDQSRCHPRQHGFDGWRSQSNAERS